MDKSSVREDERVKRAGQWEQMNETEDNEGYLITFEWMVKV